MIIALSLLFMSFTNPYTKSATADSLDSIPYLELPKLLPPPKIDPLPTTVSPPLTTSKNPYTAPTTKGNEFNMDAYTRHLWNAENAAKKGYNPASDTWTPYDDKGVPAVGPGIRVPAYRNYSGQELSSLKGEALQEHLRRARARYPTFDNLTPAQQAVLMDYTWMGVNAPEFYNLSRTGADPTPEITLKNERRQALMRDLYKTLNR